MEKVINVLYEIEEKANRILNRATEQKHKLYEQLNSDLTELESNITSDTNKKIECMKAKMQYELDTEKAALIKDCEKQVQSLESNFNAKHDDYVESVFQRIIKV